MMTDIIHLMYNEYEYCVFFMWLININVPFIVYMRDACRMTGYLAMYLS